MNDHEEFKSFGVAPKPAAANDAIEEALATAEAVVSKTYEEIVQEIPADAELSDSLSLRQVIEKAEKRLEYLSEAVDLHEPGPMEMLDSLDIKAELGRPDEATEPSYISEMQKKQNDRPATGNLDHLGDQQRRHQPRSEREWDRLGEKTGLPSVDGLPDDEMEEATHVITPARGVEKQVEVVVTESQRRRTLFFENRTAGDISEDPLWELLCSVCEEHFTGALVLSSKETERKLFFEDGQALIATSSARKDRLVELLHREGRLSDKDYIEACTAVGSTRRRAGAILVERGLISQRELFPLVQYHYETIILESFSWKNGTWQTFRGESPGAERIVLEVTTPTLVLEGMRAHVPAPELDEIVPLNVIPIVSSDGLCAIGDTGLSPEEMAIYRAADGLVSLEALSREFELPALEIQRLFAGLGILGLVEFVDSSQESYLPVAIHQSGGEQAAVNSQTGEELSERNPDEPVQEEKITEIESPANVSPPLRGLDLELAKVEAKVAQTDEGSYFDILEVSPNASEYDIQQAYEALALQFDMEHFISPELADLQPQVELIRSMIEEAYEVLKNPILCEQYRGVVVDEKNR
ncbi:MAG: DUF4388 domain-containing protein [Proteobacteria bacterium]|nr:DUF4388 domain-containing protein [Pseudomonadota bacterium]